jgi:hypothetical protein
MSNPMMQVDAVMPTSQQQHHHHHRPITNLSCRNEKMRRRESFATNLWSNEKMRSESSDKFCDVLEFLSAAMRFKLKFKFKYVFVLVPPYVCGINTERKLLLS